MSVELTRYASIVSSIGEHGVRLRIDDRISWNVRHPVTRIHSLNHGFRRLAEIKEARNNREGGPLCPSVRRRDLMRFISNGDVAQSLLHPDHPHVNHVEVALPIGEGDWYISMARNGSERRSTSPRAVMREKITSVSSDRDPLGTIQRVIEEGYSFNTDLSEYAAQEQVYNLWRDAFGWTQEQVKNLSDRLVSQKSSSELPDVWFDSLEKPDQENPLRKKTVAVGMAERLRFKRQSGKPVDVVELTEWSVDKDSRGNGYMVAVVARLISRILDDYRRAGLENDLIIIAETAIETGAYKTGYRAGLDVPNTQIGKITVDQILEQHVSVHGQRRNFAFMSLPKTSIAKYFPPEKVSDTLQLVA